MTEIVKTLRCKLTLTEEDLVGLIRDAGYEIPEDAYLRVTTNIEVTPNRYEMHYDWNEALPDE